MKLLKILLAALFIISNTDIVKAQEKGEMMLGGSIAISTYNRSKEVKGGSNPFKIDEEKINSYQILPSFHYFVDNNIALGGAIGYKGYKNLTEETNGEEIYNKTNAFYFIPSVIYYVKIYKNLFWTPSFNVGFGIGKSKQNDILSSGTVAEIDYNFSEFEIGFELAEVEYKINEKFAVGLGLGLGEFKFVSNKRKENKGDIKTIEKETTFEFGLNNNEKLANISFSFKYLF